jgi:peptidoglycan/xylan/chitin deacetylase (PgdA/CDA1 family)
MTKPNGTRFIASAIFATLCAALVAPAWSADRGDVQAACFPAQSLSMRPGESVPQKLGAPQAIRMPRMSVPQAVAPRGAIRRVELPAGKKLIALTLDLCEQWSEIAGYDGAIVDYLRANKVKATFFGGGKWMATHGERTQQLMTDDLFEVGTHGWAHKNVRGLSGVDLAREIQTPSAAYGALRQSLAANQCAAGQEAALQSVPEQPRLYRFPFGACNAESLDAVAQAGLLPIQWDVSTGDPSPTQSAQAIAREMINHTRPGSIIIAHANGRGHHTAAALPIAIPALRAKGFQFVTVSELLAAGQPVVVDSCYDSRPGDTDKYDMFFRPRQASPGASPVAGGWAPKSVAPAR